MKWLKRNPHRDSYLHKKAIPFKGNNPTKQLKIALLLCGGNVPKSRKEILKKIGSKLSKGFNASLFTTLIKNGIIQYEKGVGYQRGVRYKQYMSYCYSEMNCLGIKNKRLRDKITKEFSNAINFIENI
jgi:hypothetical protein